MGLEGFPRIAMNGQNPQKYLQSVQKLYQQKNHIFMEDFEIRMRREQHGSQIYGEEKML